MQSHKIVLVFGTRPEAIKMAPLVKELQKYPLELTLRVAVTAQHREMLDQVLELFHITPDFDLNIMQAQQTLFDITTYALKGLGAIYAAEKPDLVLVHGDTTTTFVASLAAFYQQLPVGHVEAGLRTHNKQAPFPEEMNRRLTGALADLHFAPTPTARNNLLQEGVNTEQIWVTGNTVIDALLATVRPDYQFSGPLNNLISSSAQERILLVTTHRRENWGDPLREIYAALSDLSKTFPDLKIIFPVHKNPRIRETAAQMLGECARVHLIEPLDYEPFAHLLHHSTLVLTDSGGLQEEAPALGKPVLVLRDTTERPEAVTAGTVKLVGTRRETIYEAAKTLLTDASAYAAMAQAVNPYGDGKAAQRIALALRRHFALTTEPWSAFTP